MIALLSHGRTIHLVLQKHGGGGVARFNHPLASGKSNDMACPSPRSGPQGVADERDELPAPADAEPDEGATMLDATIVKGLSTSERNRLKNTALSLGHQMSQEPKNAHCSGITHTVVQKEPARPCRGAPLGPRSMKFGDQMTADSVLASHEDNVENDDEPCASTIVDRANDYLDVFPQIHKTADSQHLALLVSDWSQGFTDDLHAVISLEPIKETADAIRIHMCSTSGRSAIDVMAERSVRSAKQGMRVCLLRPCPVMCFMFWVLVIQYLRLAQDVRCGGLPFGMADSAYKRHNYARAFTGPCIPFGAFLDF